MKNYFLPINSECLSHYFSCACIKPAKYFTNKIKDIQSKYDGYLLLTEENGTKETDCCLEILFLDEEANSLFNIPGTSYYLYQSFLPISRVVRIYFSSDEQKQRTINNVTMTSAFIPKRMLGGSENFSFDNTLEFDHFEKPMELNLTDKICRFDRYLGALALMRVARCDYMNVSENYVDTLSFFNAEIKKQFEEKKKIQRKYWGLFNGDGYAKLLSYLDKTITEEDVLSIASEEEQKIEKDKISRVIDLSRLNNYTYVVAFLFTYGVGNESRKKKIDEAIIHNFDTQEIKKGESEKLAMFYGYNRGYAAFNNSYGLMPSEKVDVKFSLEDRLDLYAIESVFNYVIKEEKLGRIDYIENLIPHKQFGKINKNEYVIVETLIIGKKKAKVLSPEYWDAFFENIEWGDFEKVKTLVEEFKRFDMIESLIKNVAKIIHEDTIAEEEDKYSSKIEELCHQIEIPNNYDKSSKKVPSALVSKNYQTSKSPNIEEQDLFPKDEYKIKINITLNGDTSVSVDFDSLIDTILEEYKKHECEKTNIIKNTLKTRIPSAKVGTKNENLIQLAMYETLSKLRG